MSTEPYYSKDGIAIYHGDCREVLPRLERADLVLTDPPYGIGEADGKNASRTNAAVARDYERADPESLIPKLLREAGQALRAMPIEGE